MDREKLEEALDDIDPKFRSETNELTSAELEAKLNALAKASEANDQEQEDDEDLSDAKAKASELGRPYREDRKAYKLKSKYVILRLKDKSGG